MTYGSKILHSISKRTIILWKQPPPTKKKRKKKYIYIHIHIYIYIYIHTHTHTHTYTYTHTHTHLLNNCYPVRLELLCTEHARDVTSKSDIEDANCVVCELTGDIGEQLFCTSCGLHYHGGCLDPAVEVGGPSESTLFSYCIVIPISIFFLTLPNSFRFS